MRAATTLLTAGPTFAWSSRSWGTAGSKAQFVTPSWHQTDSRICTKIQRFSLLAQKGTSSGSASKSGGSDRDLAGGAVGAGAAGLFAGACCRVPRSWICSPTTLSLLLFWPVCLSSQVSRCKRPETNNGSPLWQYLAATSAVRPKSVILTKTVSSLFSPLSLFQARLIAKSTSTTAVPLGVYLVSTSLVMFPIKFT